VTVTQPAGRGLTEETIVLYIQDFIRGKPGENGHVGREGPFGWRKEALTLGKSWRMPCEYVDGCSHSNGEWSDQVVDPAVSWWRWTTVFIKVRSHCLPCQTEERLQWSDLVEAL
jgi:hypothetical protein